MVSGRTFDKNEASISSFSDFNCVKVSLGNISDIDKGDTITTDSIRLSCHEILDKARTDSTLAHGWAHNESRLNCNYVEPFVFRKSFLVIPSCFLSNSLALCIEAHAFWSIRITPMTLVVSKVTRFVSVGHVLYCSDT